MEEAQKEPRVEGQWRRSGKAVPCSKMIDESDDLFDDHQQHPAYDVKSKSPTDIDEDGADDDLFEQKLPKARAQAKVVFEGEDDDLVVARAAELKRKMAKNVHETASACSSPPSTASSDKAAFDKVIAKVRRASKTRFVKDRVSISFEVTSADEADMTPEESDDSSESDAFEDAAEEGMDEGVVTGCKTVTKAPQPLAPRKSETASAERQNPVHWVVLVVHGIGAEDYYLNRNMAALDETIEFIKQHWFWHTDVEVHIEMVGWKDSVQSAQETTFHKLTPNAAKSTRMQINNSVGDVIYYMTKHHRQTILSAVAKRMNETVRMLKGHASGRFKNSRFAIMGHSLGSVICYDLLSDGGHEDKLDVNVEHFFLLGSPLAAFLAISERDDDEDKRKSVFTLPDKIPVYNIFHPHDPVSFRLEPLYYPDLATGVEAELLPYWANNGVRPLKQWVESYENVKSKVSSKLRSFSYVVWNAMNGETMTRWGDQKELIDDVKIAPNAHAPVVRIDYVLQEHPTETMVERYGMLHGHFTYWSSRDFVFFLMKRLTNSNPSLSVEDLQQAEDEHRERVEAGQAGIPAPPSGSDVFHGASYVSWEEASSVAFM